MKQTEPTTRKTVIYNVSDFWVALEIGSNWDWIQLDPKWLRPIRNRAITLVIKIVLSYRGSRFNSPQMTVKKNTNNLIENSLMKGMRYNTFLGVSIFFLKSVIWGELNRDPRYCKYLLNPNCACIRHPTETYFYIDEIHTEPNNDKCIPLKIYISN